MVCGWDEAHFKSAGTPHEWFLFWDVVVLALNRQDKAGGKEQFYIEVFILCIMIHMRITSW
jgi:hypothetical protein